MLEAMTLRIAAWECVSPITSANCFRKAGISCDSQARWCADDDPFKLLAAQLEEFQKRCECPTDFTVDSYVDADADVVNSEAYLLTDSETIARVTQTQLDVTEHDDENGEDDLDWEMPPPRKDQVRQTIEILQSCCRREEDAEKKMQKKVTEKEELYEILLLKQKQNLILLTFLSFTSGHLNTP